MPSVAEIIGLKTPTPTALDTAGIRSQWSQRLREQALFSARMTLQGYLDRVQTVLMQVADGTLDTSAARLALTDTLAQLGYAPEPGTEGTLNHARTLARLHLGLDTNQKTAASLARLAESEDPQIAALFPAWELLSTGYRKNHRTDWPQRWKAAGERVAWRGASRTKMVALKSSPIWQALGDGAGGFRDTLGNPYPPFAFGSSYAWVHVDRIEARELGLLGEENGERKTANRSPLTVHREAPSGARPPSSSPSSPSAPSATRPATARRTAPSSTRTATATAPATAGPATRSAGRRNPGADKSCATSPARRPKAAPCWKRTLRPKTGTDEPSLGRHASRTSIWKERAAGRAQTRAA